MAKSIIDDNHPLATTYIEHSFSWLCCCARLCRGSILSKKK